MPFHGRAAGLTAPSACRAQPQVRFRGEAGIDRQAAPAGSFENDPQRTWAKVRSVFLWDATSVRLLQWLLKRDVSTFLPENGHRSRRRSGFVDGMQRVQKSQQGGRND